MNRHKLLLSLLRVYAAQPATALWRAIEIDALKRFGIPVGRGLDIGCGDGKLTAILLESAGSRQLVGVDIDPLETEMAASYDFYEAVHTVPADQIPENSESFDFVVSNSVLEHIPNLRPTLHEIARLLRPGGHFAFTVPGIGFHQALRGSIVPWVDRATYLERLDRRLAHLRYLSAQEWYANCAEVGLEVQSCLGYMAPPEVRRWETISRFTGGLLYSMVGHRRQPIEIQRTLGLRQAQNLTCLPAGVTKVAAKFISAGLDFRHESDHWLDENEAGCILVAGTCR